jgi:hypothetical protein
MKFLFSILALVFTTKECENRKENNDFKKTEIVSAERSSDQQKDYIIEYSAVSRGTFKGIKINKTSVSVQKDRNSKPIVTELNNEVREGLINNLEEVDLSMLPKLKAPTEKRTYDAAAHATLKITVDGKTYSTSSFDHGFPPEEIKTLCNKIVEFLE